MCDKYYEKLLRLHGLYTRRILDVIKDCDVNLETLLRSIAELPGASIVTYPNGTLQIGGPGVNDAFQKQGGDCFRDLSTRVMMKEENYLKAKSPLGRIGCASLAAYPPNGYVVFDWGEHVKKWNNESIGVRTGRSLEDVPGRQIKEHPVDNLLVSVAFKRRFSKAARQHFVELVAGWLADVGTQGMFGEGPVYAVSKEVLFYKRLAQFRIDGSRSGQNTINWLILLLIEFAVDRVITDICFTEQPFVNVSFEEHYELSKDNPVALPLPELNRAPGEMRTVHTEPPTNRKPERADANDISHVPDDVLPMEIITSEHFKVLVALPFEIDSLTVTIYFEQLPNAKERNEFREVIRAWCIVGQLGGFGGNGFHYFEELQYAEETDSASFFCDMGIADFELSIKILVFMLDSSHAQGMAPIEALVVGRVVTDIIDTMKE